MPNKDPQNFSILAYLAFGLLSMWGGIAAYIRVIQKNSKEFKWREAFM